MNYDDDINQVNDAVVGRTDNKDPLWLLQRMNGATPADAGPVPRSLSRSRSRARVVDDDDGDDDLTVQELDEDIDDKDWHHRANITIWNDRLDFHNTAMSKTDPLDHFEDWAVIIDGEKEVQHTDQAVAKRAMAIYFRYGDLTMDEFAKHCLSRRVASNESAAVYKGWVKWCEKKCQQWQNAIATHITKTSKYIYKRYPGMATCSDEERRRVLLMWWDTDPAYSALRFPGQLAACLNIRGIDYIRTEDAPWRAIVRGFFEKVCDVVWYDRILTSDDKAKVLNAWKRVCKEDWVKGCNLPGHGPSHVPVRAYAGVERGAE